MKLHCPNCGTDFELTAEAVGAAIAAAEQQADHCIEHCPQCQWDVRVSLAELRAAETIAKPAAKPKRTARGKTELVVEITVAPKKARGTAKPKRKAKVSARKPAKPKDRQAAKK